MRPPSLVATRIVWLLTILLCAILVVAGTRRLAHLPSRSPTALRSPETAALNGGFDEHPWLTAAHIVPGLLFTILGPLQFVRTLRTRRPGMHRWMGRVVMASGAIVGISALVMSPRMAIGGINETAATMVFALLFLSALGKGFIAIRERRMAAHREWMIRSFGIGLAVAFVRPIVGVFFATRRITGLTPHDFFGIAFWLGFTLQTIAAEVWIDYTRRSSRDSVKA
jgi:uncharacterized membrane protein